MEPSYVHSHHGHSEVNNKKGRDFQQTYSKDTFPQFGGHTDMNVFEESAIVNKNKQSKKNCKPSQEEFAYPSSTPKMGTFDPPSYAELMKKSKELFEKRHHILAKLSSNGVYDQLDEDDVDLVELMRDTLNQPDILYKETSKAVVQN